MDMLFTGRFIRYTCPIGNGKVIREMRTTNLFILTAAICMGAASCVNVTTERRSSSAAESPDGRATKKARVEVTTYGWNFMDAALFPFKTAYRAARAAF